MSLTSEMVDVGRVVQWVSVAGNMTRVLWMGGHVAADRVTSEDAKCVSDIVLMIPGKWQVLLCSTFLVISEVFGLVALGNLNFVVFQRTLRLLFFFLNHYSAE